MNTSPKTGWPTVLKNDPGIRPAGAPDECFYCRQKVGQEHARDCVMVSKLVKIRYTIEVIVDVPHGWDPEQIEFHRTESSSCADNIVREIQQFQESLNSAGKCMCGRIDADFVEAVDDTPVVFDGPEDINNAVSEAVKLLDQAHAEGPQ